MVYYDPYAKKMVTGDPRSGSSYPADPYGDPRSGSAPHAGSPVPGILTTSASTDLGIGTTQGAPLRPQTTSNRAAGAVLGLDNEYDLLGNPVSTKKRSASRTILG